MAVTFDNTLKAATRLRDKGGFSETQSKPELVATFADGFVENLATKDDVAHLRGDAKELEVSLCVRAALGPGAHQRSASLALHGSAQPITIGTADRNRHRFA